MPRSGSRARKGEPFSIRFTLATDRMVQEEASRTRRSKSAVVEALTEDYVRTAFAYGLPRRDVYFRYALKATLIPLLTVIGLTYGYLLGGAVVAEYVFDWPGIGSYVVRAITQSDYPAAVGVTLFLAAAYLTINLIVDLLYFLVDPRLRRA